MQTANLRYISLTLLLVVGAGLFAVVSGPTRAAAPRWPTADEVYSVAPWSAGPLVVDSSSGHSNLVSRVFRSPRGAAGTLTLIPSNAPKLYAAGAEVPFLGTGYSVEPLSTDSSALDAAGIGGLLARRGTEEWLVFYAFGERRGLLGNGLYAWAVALFDGILGRPNDYYKLYFMVRSDQLDDGAQRDVAELAGGLFPQVAAWYGA